MKVFSDKLWLLHRSKNKKVDANALAESTKMLIEINKDEMNFWTNAYLASQGVLATIFATLLSLYLSSYIFILLIIEIIISVIFVIKINSIQELNSSLIEAYMGIQTKKSGCTLIMLEGDNIKNLIKFVKHKLSKYKVKIRELDEL
ncbi:MAG: hypothetical protein WA139_04995 [Candidatus Aenigmatarchaeota archaeon]